MHLTNQSQNNIIFSIITTGSVRGSKPRPMYRIVFTERMLFMEFEEKFGKEGITYDDVLLITGGKLRTSRRR